MAVIGALGDIVFEVSANKVETFDDMEWNMSAKYAEHDRHLDFSLPEFTGNDLDEIPFNMKLSANHGVDPMKEIVKLTTAKREGRTLPLVIGEKAYGTYRWVIQTLKFGMKRFDNKGKLIEADASVTLKMYPG
jgi:phage protein U